MTIPLVSVLLPVYNGSRYLKEAIDSVLQQSFADFELIVINDGSTDSTGEIIASCSDPRIRYFEQQNRGLSATLNRAISLARGSYLARQDSDDISYPERFARQVAFLDSNPCCGMVGTWAEIWRERRRSGAVHRHPAGNDVLQFLLLFNNPFVHSSVMMRRDAVAAVGGYLSDRSRQLPEDYELWSRIARRYQVANIPEVLHVYRETGGSICRENWDRLMADVVWVSARNIAWRAGVPDDDAGVADLAALSNVIFHMASANPDVARMRRLFDEAAQGIRSGAAASGELEKAIRIKWRDIRVNHFRFLVAAKLREFQLRLGARG